MQNGRYFQYLNLPTLPQSLIAKLNFDVTEYSRKTESQVLESFLWSDDHNRDLDKWGKEFVGSDLYFAFQIMGRDVPIHKDQGSICKLNYILDPGGNNVITQWWADDKITMLQEVTLKTGRWHIFRSDVYHSVNNIEPGKSRFAITARLFP